MCIAVIVSNLVGVDQTKTIYHPSFRGMETGCTVLAFRPFGGVSGVLCHYEIIG